MPTRRHGGIFRNMSTSAAETAIMIAALYSLADWGQADPSWLDDREQAWDIIEASIAAEGPDNLAERARWLEQPGFHGDTAWLRTCRAAVEHLASTQPRTRRALAAQFDARPSSPLD